MSDTCEWCGAEIDGLGWHEKPDWSLSIAETKRIDNERCRSNMRARIERAEAEKAEAVARAWGEAYQAARSAVDDYPAIWNSEGKVHKEWTYGWRSGAHEAAMRVGNIASAPADAPQAEASGRWRPEVAAFADAMERELRAKDHRKGWKDCDVIWLVGRLLDETSELQRAVSGDGDVLSEAADVANFAMMIADVCGALSYSDATGRWPYAVVELVRAAEAGHGFLHPPGISGWLRSAIDAIPADLLEAARRKPTPGR